jgi:predicted dehydrogenase
VLGAARIAELAIVKPARATGMRLVAVAARDQERATTFAAQHGVERVLPSYDDVLAARDVEAVYNPLPNGLHGRRDLAAIEAGKHVLSEKPFTANAEKAVEVSDAAHRADVVVVEGFHYLFHPVTRRLYELTVGLRGIGRTRARRDDDADQGPRSRSPRWSLALAGGATMDVGCYSLHAQRMLAEWGGGEPSLVAAQAGERPGAPGVDEWLEAQLVSLPGLPDERCHMVSDRVEMIYR